MKFCPKCGSILLPEKDKKKVLLKCKKCGFSEKSDEKPILREKVKPTRKVEVVEEGDVTAVYDHKCIKCGHDKSQLIQMHPQYGDEDDVILWKCGKCGFVEREKTKEK